MTDTTTTVTYYQARKGDILTVTDASGKEILRAVLVAEDDGPWLGLPNGATVRHASNNLQPLWLTMNGRSYTITREVPALPTELNTVLLDVETHDGTVYPAVRVGYDGCLNAYGSDGRFVGGIRPADVVAYTLVIPGERVEVTR